MEDVCRIHIWPFGLFYGHLVYFMAIRSILRPFGILYGHLVFFMVTFPHFGMLYQEKFGIPVSDTCVGFA
jgi:hypothetical protein